MGADLPLESGERRVANEVNTIGTVYELATGHFPSQSTRPDNELVPAAAIDRLNFISTTRE
jgi:hypothetical protein